MIARVVNYHCIVLAVMPMGGQLELLSGWTLAVVLSQCHRNRVKAGNVPLANPLGKKSHISLSKHPFVFSYNLKWAFEHKSRRRTQSILF